MIEYRVIDLQTEVIDPNPPVVKAATPEKAAEIALGVQLTRSGGRNDLRARVYFQTPGQPVSMVRLYTKSAHPRRTPVPTPDRWGR